MGNVGELKRLEAIVTRFCEERDWDQFHGPKDMAIGLITEASELLEKFRFQNDEQSMALFNDSKSRLEIEEELADVFFFLLRFASRHQIGLESALMAKMMKNAEKYPVEKARGSNRKYDQL
ncbi:MAG TPA: nucleotide pyrophosphohydrolase [Bdellovibrionales bacterium]|nr:nucleotide pyrophosphohydrolase [Bdellovibrionales bacterium]